MTRSIVQKSPAECWDLHFARTKDLSVFSQTPSIGDAIKEIQNATLRLSSLFLFNGDPNPRYNPSGVSMFDIITTLFAFTGLALLYKTNRKLFFISLFLCIPMIVNDIFSIEKVPEMHYYGLGHPNTLRLAGIIPIIYFWFASGINAFRNICLKIDKKSYPIVLTGIIGIIALINWHLYFDQASIDQKNFLFNYKYNQVRQLQVVDIINKSQAKVTYISPSYATDAHVTYFSRKNVVFKPFRPKSEADALATITASELTIFDGQWDGKLEDTLYLDSLKQPPLFNMEPIVNPIDGYEALSFSKIH